MYLAALDGTEITSARTSSLGRWERVSLDSGQTAFNEIALYSVGNGAAFYVSGVTASNATAPIPEPAAWMMMIAGLGAMGALMRRRPARVVLA